MTEEEQAVALSGAGCVVCGRGGAGEAVVVPAGEGEVDGGSVVPGEGDLLEVGLYLL